MTKSYDNDLAGIGRGAGSQKHTFTRSLPLGNGFKVLQQRGIRKISTTLKVKNYTQSVIAVIFFS